MIHAQNVIYENALVPAAQTGSTLTSAIDTNGCAYVTLIASFGAIAASGDLTAFKLTESTASGGSYTDVASGAITNATVGTASLPAADDDNKVFVWQVNVLNLTKRFIKLQADCHASNAATLGVIAIKSRLSESPAETTAGTGAEAIVRI
jgi:hypothetical protein